MIDSIDVHDLPEKDIEVIKGLVEFLRGKTRNDKQLLKSQTNDDTFTTVGWSLRAKENLSRKDIYE